MKNKKNYIFGGVILGSIVTAGIIIYKVYQTKKKSIWDDSDVKEREYVDAPAINPEVSDEVREALLKDWNRPSLLSPESEVTMASIESPEDDEEDPIKEEEKEELEHAEEMDREYKENKGRPPKIISAKDLGSVPEGYEEVIWDYYKFDDTVADEDMNEIVDYQRFIGDALDKFDFRNNDEDTLYVLSYEFAAVYEINKLYLSFSDKLAKNEQYYDDLKAYGYKDKEEDDGEAT